MAAIATIDLTQQCGGMTAADNHDRVVKERHEVDPSVVDMAGLR